MIQCPYCQAVNEAAVSNQEETMDVLNQGPVKVMVPVWECTLCGNAWTDHEADEARSAALILGSGKRTGKVEASTPQSAPRITSNPVGASVPPLPSSPHKNSEPSQGSRPLDESVPVSRRNPKDNSEPS